MKLVCNKCDKIDKDVFVDLDFSYKVGCKTKCVLYNNCTKKADSSKYSLTALLNSVDKLCKDSTNLIIKGREPVLSPKFAPLLYHLIRERSDFSTYRIIIETCLSPQLTKESYSKILPLIAELQVNLFSGRKEKDYLAQQFLPSFAKVKSAAERRFHLLHSLCYRYPEKISVNLILKQGIINNIGDLRYALNTLGRIGVKHVNIVDETPYITFSISFERLTGEKLPSPYTGGCETLLYRHENFQPLTPRCSKFLRIKSIYNETKLPSYLKGITLPPFITLKRNCFLVEKNIPKTKKDSLKIILRKLLFLKGATYKVIFENGSNCDSYSTKKCL